MLLLLAVSALVAPKNTLSMSPFLLPNRHGSHRVRDSSCRSQCRLHVQPTDAHGPHHDSALRWQARRQRRTRRAGRQTSLGPQVHRQEYFAGRGALRRGQGAAESHRTASGRSGHEPEWDSAQTHE